MLAVGLGGTLVGAPVTGLVVDAFGPHWAVAVGAASGFASLGVGARYLVRHQQLRIRLDGPRIRLSLNAPADPHDSTATDELGPRPLDAGTDLHK